jgi:beta-glucosidase
VIYRWAILMMAAAAAAVVALVAVSTPASTEPTMTEQKSGVNPKSWPAVRYPVPVNAEWEARIAALLKRMTPEEKVGQLLQADLSAVTPADVKTYHLGSVLNGGNSGPYGNDLAPPADWLKLADEFYAASVDTSGGRTGVPLIWGIDAVHGHSNIVGATLFPHNIGLGAMRDPDLIEHIGRATAIEIRATGQEWTFAPTITVPQDYRWGRAYEGYSSDTALVASYVGRMIKGLQGPPDAGPMLKGPYVLASTKHFIADGGTDAGRDQGDANISEAVLRDVHGAPYVPAIEAGVATVMTSFSSWQGVKIAGHKGLVTDVLKDRMNFGGFVVTDWNAHGQIAGCTNASCPQAVNAGIDMYMAPDSWKDLYRSLLSQVKDGTVPVARLDDAVARVLRVKMRLGLFDAGKPSSRPFSGKFDRLGAPEHRAIARTAVAKSLVLLKNDGGVLPLRPGGRILVAGDGADDIARASGGWTLSWQGTGLNNSHFPGATSIWAGIRDAVSAGGGTATHSPDGTFTTKPDAAIVVFGETPYAEFQGDIPTLELKPELRKPLETMRKLKAQGIPVIALMITGRPLFVNAELNTASAFVVAWLPGSEGGGVADMLFRAKDGGVRPFTGRLPTAWPRTAVSKGPVLFPFGYGLPGGSGAPAWVPLPEESGVADAGGAGVYFDKGVPSASWSLNVSDGAGAVTRITTTPAEAIGGRVRVTAVNSDTVQEGARQFELKGGGAQVVELVNFEPIDVSRATSEGQILQITMRVDKAPTAPISVSARSGAAGGAIAVPEIAALPVGQWVTVGVTLQCFKNAGADMAKLSAPLHLATDGSVTFSVSRVAVGPADPNVRMLAVCR